MKRYLFYWITGLIFINLGYIEAQELPTDIKEKLSVWLSANAREKLSIGKIKIDSSSVDTRNKKVQLFANLNCSYIPFTKENVSSLYKGIKEQLPAEYGKFDIELITDNHSIEQLIQITNKKNNFATDTKYPLVSNLSSPNKPKQGLQDKHIALWQSHGYYFEQKLSRWEWQRARIFQTVEDLYTQSYVLPYLIPMLENAGANVLIPRERDWQTNEVIVDNDGSRNASYYIESNTKERWYEGSEKGFAYKRDRYIDNENPFNEGTYREINTIKKGKESLAEWIPSIPETGRYTVYVSYKSLNNSTDDALYTIYHKGGATRFKVNQTMGGGTWIYLGLFEFDKGDRSGKITLSNLSRKTGAIVTADAVKIGGGMGNIARKVNGNGIVSLNRKSSDATSTEQAKAMPDIPYEYEVSGYPRFTEAARYWLQWAGIPDSVYSPSNGENDYTDDYKCRGTWVNYLSGGSPLNKEMKGLNIPIDLAFAFHSDAGTTMNDSIIGTLGIYCTSGKEGTFDNGSSRYISRDLTDLIQSNIVNDIRRLYEPDWSRRGMWNQSYFEARVPKVPTMLLELLSHQNFADMRYGLDPRFRFSVSRAIYKGMLQFIAMQKGEKYIVQPLPVDHFSVSFNDKDEAELSWQPVTDSLEPTAKPDQYIVYTRIANGDFDNGTVVNKTHCTLRQDQGVRYSYKVTAMNKGGESFPSEILSAYKAFREKGTILIINGFDRVSAPDDFVSDGIAGFYDERDHGVPDKLDISFIGSQCEFRRMIPWMDDDAAGFGASRANYESKVVAGNTFDYPASHGDAIAKAGYSYVSCSNEAVEDGLIDMKNYRSVDLILGKQKEVTMGRGACETQFKTYSPALQSAITEYCDNGGNIFVSGSFLASDLWDKKNAKQEDKYFATKTLKYKWRTGQAAIEGKVKSVASPFLEFTGVYDFYDTPNPDSYVVESPDAIEPAESKCHTIFRYSENNLSAGVAYKDKYKACILGFPFESIKSQEGRYNLMNAILTFFSKQTDQIKHE